MSYNLFSATFFPADHIPFFSSLCSLGSIAHEFLSTSMFSCQSRRNLLWWVSDFPSV
ncbi:hypothetical protein MBAV_006289 [Candidatus Magnetobacterium bavaricum]|uniref:Uncharacterized protein n=1 Tax=Candidatus Magnetobacterium bavaricum TaxID=29290 RepID=A0A0F3GHV1_9BACT|nr:hypothetical protein MBAV_006289 [Candidatus Magnetobacterium bavaricum]